jgi:hypothetical protein
VEITIFAVVKALNKNGPMVIGNQASDTRQNLDFYSKILTINLYCRVCQKSESHPGTLVYYTYTLLLFTGIVDIIRQDADLKVTDD